MITLNQKKTVYPAGCGAEPRYLAGKAACESKTALPGLVHLALTPRLRRPPLSRERGHREAKGVSAALLLALALTLLAPGLGRAQIPTDGTVKSFQKISDTESNFTATLDNSDSFGYSVATLGDLDGDGVTDLAVGAHADDDGGYDRGAVYVLFMQSNGTVKSYQKISDTEGNFTATLENMDHFGISLAAPGDLDGDGATDLAVGAHGDDDGGSGRGAVYVLFMNTDGTVKSYQKISDTAGSFTATLTNSDYFGISVASLGDLDGDGVTDLAVGAYQDDDGGPSGRGAVYAMFMNANGTVKSFQKISVTEGNFTATLDSGDQFGRSVANIGDLDGDGVTDLTVGAYGDDGGGLDWGAVYVLFLQTDGMVKSFQKISATEGDFTTQLNDYDRFGVSVAALGDIDGDGVEDLVAGAYNDDDGGTDRGTVYVLFMNTTGTVKSYQKISDTTGNFAATLDDYNNFGNSVTALTDLDGDGVTDLAVGAYGDDDGGTDRGAVYVLFLKAAGLVAHYPFNGNANDESGNGNDGTVNGATLAVDRFGTANSAYSFDGDGYIRKSDLSLALEDFTISLWLNATDIPSWYRQAFSIHSGGGGGNAGDRNISVQFDSEEDLQITLSTSDGGRGVSVAGRVIVPQEWYHVAFERDSDRLKFFMDGQLIAGSSDTQPTFEITNGYLEIGAPNYWNGGWTQNGRDQAKWKGLLDDIRIYNRALSEAEIQALYHEGETVDITGPTIADISTTSSPGIGDNITVTATITDAQGLQSVALRYAKGGSASYSQTSMLSLGADTHSGTIPATAVTAAGVACFIAAEDNLGNVSRSDTASIQVSFPSGTLTTSMSGSAFRTGFPKNKWRLISIPGDIDTKSVSSIIQTEMDDAPSDETWKIFRYTGPGSDDYVAASNFASGESYFLKQVVEESVHFTLGAGWSVDLTGWSLTLGSRKWHFVSSPYPFAVSVAADQGAFKGPYAYGAFGSGGQEGWSTAQVQTTFEPWGGYIIYNNTDQTQTLELKPPGLAKDILAKTEAPLKTHPLRVAKPPLFKERGTTKSGGELDPEPSQSGWLLHLTAEGARYFDEGNTIGRIEGASNDRDELDSPEPPYLDGYISLAMERPDWSPSAGMSLFTSDVRALDETNGLWDLDLRTRGETGPITITYNIQGEVPPGSQVMLLDLAQRRACDLTAGEPPEAIANYSEQLPYRLKVIAGTPEYVQGAIEEALAQLPEEFALSPNYPNPFNPSTTIEYALPLPARVSLRVYNLLGREIAVLVNDWQDMGYYEIIWQGRDQAGRSAASGVYFAILQADGRVLTRKMLLLK